MMYLGDFRRSQSVYFFWSSNTAAGASVTRATNGTISVYKNNSDTQTTTGVTDSEDADTLTGVHRVVIATTDAFYVAGADYTVILSAATIDGQTVNSPLAHFSIENRWGQEAVEATAQAGAAQSITLAAAESSTDDAVNGDYIYTLSGTGAQQFRQITDYTGASRVATVDRAWVTTPDSTTVYRRYPGSLGSTIAEVADGVWDELTAGHTTAGSTGKAVIDILADTGTDGVTVSAAGVAAILTTAMTEAYSTDGSTMTVAQALHMIYGLLGEFAISGTTLTVKKVDGSTTAATFTLSDATNPTSITRAS